MPRAASCTPPRRHAREGGGKVCLLSWCRISSVPFLPLLRRNEGIALRQCAMQWWPGGGGEMIFRSFLLGPKRPKRGTFRDSSHTPPGPIPQCPPPIIIPARPGNLDRTLGPAAGSRLACHVACHDDAWRFVPNTPFVANNRHCGRCSETPLSFPTDEVSHRVGTPPWDNIRPSSPHRKRSLVFSYPINALFSANLSDHHCISS